MLKTVRKLLVRLGRLSWYFIDPSTPLRSAQDDKMWSIAPLRYHRKSTYFLDRNNPLEYTEYTFYIFLYYK